MLSSIPPDFYLKMGSPDDWKRKITEMYRIDRQLLSTLPSHIFTDIKKWEQEVNFSFTPHAMQRMKEYVWKQSLHPWDHDRHYIEFYPQEEQYLNNPRNLQAHFSQAKLVEVGLNSFGKVCKLSYVLKLHEVAPFLYDQNFLHYIGEDEVSRILFFCVGLDGYLKTLNITPNEKKRKYYGGSVQYLDEKSFLSVVHGT